MSAQTARTNQVTFWTLQLVIIGAAVAVGAYRAKAWNARGQLPPLREKPLAVEPLYNVDAVISDEQLSRVLTRLRPRLEGEKTKINHIDHGLRFWTMAARFDNPDLLSGEQMRELLTDDRRFRELYGEKMKPLLIDEPQGVQVREVDGIATSSHVDHTMACLAEVGTSLNFILVTRHGERTFREMLEHSLATFSLNQVEYEWSALTYALFLPPTRSWVTSEGQEMNFDRLARRMMRETLPEGVCMGNHRLYTLAVFLRIDDQTPILEPETRREIATFLADCTTRLVKFQHPDGFWNDTWPDAVAASSTPSTRDGDRIQERILATGHALEWWAIVPEKEAAEYSIHPPRHVLAAAGQWLVKTIDGLTDQEILQHYTYLTHAGRALSLWRGHWPPDVPLADVAHGSRLPAGRSRLPGGTVAALQPTITLPADIEPPTVIEPLVPLGKRHLLGYSGRSRLPGGTVAALQPTITLPADIEPPTVIEPLVPLGKRHLLGQW